MTPDNTTLVLAINHILEELKQVQQALIELSKNDKQNEIEELPR